MKTTILLSLSLLMPLNNAFSAEKPVFSAHLPLVSGAGLAAGQKLASGKKPARQIVNLKFCPISGESVENDGKGGQIVGNYRVKFCCADCPGSFAKLPAKEKLARVAELAARQAKAKRS